MRRLRTSTTSANRTATFRPVGARSTWGVRSVPVWVAVHTPSANTVSNASGVRFRVWPVLRSWTEGTVTWNTPWLGAGVKDATDRDLSNPVGLMVLRTEDVQGSVALSSHAWGLIEGWADGLANHGFVIGDEGPDGEINLHSDEAATVAKRPVLRVIYRKPAC